MTTNYLSPIVVCLIDDDRHTDENIVSGNNEYHDCESNIVFHLETNNDDCNDEVTPLVVVVSIHDSILNALCFMTFCFAGFMAGVIASIFGYELLTMFFTIKNNTPLSRMEVFTYGLAWSMGTTLICYCLYRLLQLVILSITSSSSFQPSYQMNSNKHEIAFATSVFGGYCFACITIDILNGIVWTHNVCTFLVVICWAVFIRYITHTLHKAEPVDS